MYMHSEADLAPVVAAYIREHGIGYWPEIYRHIENVLPLTEADCKPLNDRDTMHWQCHAQNLKSNRTLTKLYHDIINVSGGFATTQYAEDNGVAEQTLGARCDGTKTPRAPRPMKISGKGEDDIRKCWSHCFKDLKELYDRDMVLADVKDPEMTAVAFGEKYNLTPKLV